MLVTLSVGSCNVWLNQIHPSDVWHYKTTIEIETPAGIRVGSAVREAVISTTFKFLPEAPSGTVGIRGEAIPIVLDQGRTIFAIMDVDGSYQEFIDSFPAGGAPATPSGVRYYRATLKPGLKVTAPERSYPKFAMFKDIKDPKSVVVANPNDLESVFGKGIKIKQITLEITNEPVTSKMRKILPSFGEETGFNEWQKTLRYGDPRALSLDNFIRN